VILPNLQPIIEAVRQASNLCRQVQQIHVVHSEKPGREPVTIADYGSQAILCRAISKAFPDDAIVAEEQSDQFLNGVAAPQREQVVNLVSQILGEAVSEADLVKWLDYGRDRQNVRTWVIDPIDGTKGFLALRRYTIAVGMLENGQPVGSVMGCPGYPIDGKEGRIFYVSDGVAYMQGMDGGEAQRIHVSERNVPSIRVAESVEAAHADHAFMARVYEIAGITDPAKENVDGQDKYGMVACGDADLYLRVSPDKNYAHKVWDHAAGVALVQAAGGKATDLDGSALDFSLGQTLEKNKYIIVSNGKIHDAILQALREALATR
jgi:3'(2'), 5'-bisphosphate nucleotidase